MPRHASPGIAAAFAALFAPSLPAGAEETNGWDGAALQRAFELPAHRLLMRVIEGTDRHPAPFVTDGCSGGLSRAWEIMADRFPDLAAAHQSRPPWEDCCVIHDRVYHVAGGAATAEASYDARLAADEALRQCVIDTGAQRAAVLSAHYGVSETQVLLAYVAVADAMFGAVRFGGGPCSGLPWRWGYGYPGCLLGGG